MEDFLDKSPQRILAECDRTSRRKLEFASAASRNCTKLACFDSEFETVNIHLVENNDIHLHSCGAPVESIRGDSLEGDL